MGTTIRPELCEKSRYRIEKHRYYELKHFCLQYPIWKKGYASLDGMSKRPDDLLIFSKTRAIGNPTAKCAEAKLSYSERMGLVEKTASDTDSSLSNYILKAVTEGISYDRLKVGLGIPCCKDTYYELYRRFFWLLNRVRN